MHIIFYLFLLVIFLLEKNIRLFGGFISVVGTDRYTECFNRVLIQRLPKLGANISALEINKAPSEQAI